MSIERSWNPHVTVATIVYRDGKYLVVKELDEGKEVYNQPAGHLEPHESLIEAAERETYEETGWRVQIDSLLGVSRYVAPSNGETYIRFSFIATPLEHDVSAVLDDGIISAHWLTKSEIIALKHALRSPLIVSDIKRFETGITLPLSSLYDHPEN
jgi:8-oxo-dGTP pyrophosphatase MutT (NUDIX family)